MDSLKIHVQNQHIGTRGTIFFYSTGSCITHIAIEPLSDISGVNLSDYMQLHKQLYQPRPFKHTLMYKNVWSYPLDECTYAHFD